LAGDWFSAFPLGNPELPAESLLFGEEKETAVNLAMGGFPTFGVIKRLYHFISLCF
jgi:hypothetical protein